MECISENLTQLQRYAMTHILDFESLPTAKRDGGNLIVESYHGGYLITVTLCDVEEDFLDAEGYYLENLTFHEDGNYFRITAEQQKYDEEGVTSVSLTFQELLVDVKVHRIMPSFFHHPWFSLAYVANELVEKSKLADSVNVHSGAVLLNDKEQALLPLCKELSLLSFTISFDEEAENLLKQRVKAGEEIFSNLIAFLRAHMERSEVYERCLVKLEKGWRRRIEEIDWRLWGEDELKRIFGDKDTEAAWRRLSDMIIESQAMYPLSAMVRTYQEHDKVQAIRTLITKELGSIGYTGTYPEFHKRGPLRGMHIVDSNNMCYIVTGKKSVDYWIRVVENYVAEDINCGYLDMRFRTGTVLSVKEQVTDTYGAWFESKGMRLHDEVSMLVSIEADRQFVPEGETIRDPIGDEDNSTGDSGCNAMQEVLDTLHVAVKRAELAKLTKEEKEAYFGTTQTLRIFLTFFLLGGGAYGILMTLAMLLMAVIVTLIFGQASMLGEVILGFAWWKITAFAWIAFGGIMGILTVIGKNR